MVKARQSISGTELVARYKTVFGIPAEAPITEEMVRRHWDLERALTRELLDSTPESRWETFERCYSQLYGELDWLNAFQGADSTLLPDYLYGDWAALLGDPPLEVYEIGSGKGNLALYLAEKGFQVKGSEVTRQRGQRWIDEHPNLSWGVCDGVHFEEFEPLDRYDAVISDQVIEHLHPDDLEAHFRSVLKILRPGGRYLMSTPHTAYGPMDVSRVFLLDEPHGMHLKEYTHAEILRALRRAGFSRVVAPLRLPRKVRRLFGGAPAPRGSALYLGYLLVVEILISALPTQRLRRTAARILKFALFEGITLIAFKPTH